MTDDFLTQIKQAEKEAQNMLEHARQKAQEKIEKAKKEQEKDRAEVLVAAREKGKGKLAEKQGAMKKVYQDLLSEKKREADTLKKASSEKMEKVCVSAENYFLNELLG